MGIFDQLKQGTNNISSMAKNTVEINRLKGIVNAKNQEKAQRLLAIGETVYRHFDQDEFDHDAVNQELSTTIHLTAVAIAQLQTEIDQINQRIKAVLNLKTCACGHDVPLETKFCPACGHPFDNDNSVAEEN